MRQAAKETGMSGKTEVEKMRAVAEAYSKKRECSVQEAVYLLTPELWLRKTFSKVIFLNSNVPEKRYRMFRSKEDLEGVPGDGTDIFQRNMLDRYLDRPDATFKSGKFAYLDSICFAEFLSYYYVHCKSKEETENDNQPVVLDHELMSLQHSAIHQNETISLMSSNEILKRRKVREILRYHDPNLNRNPEQYAHHLLFSFYPFRDEGNLKQPPISGNYLAKLQQPEVLNVVNQNKLVMVPFSDFVDAALANVFQCKRDKHDTFLEQENDETEIEIREAVDIFLENEDPAAEAVFLEDISQIQSNIPVLIQDEELNPKIRSLNDKQKNFFDLVHGWAKKSVKNLSSLVPTAIELLHTFSREMLVAGRAF